MSRVTATFEEKVLWGLDQLGLEATSQQLQQLRDFSEEYFKWNTVHNLSAIHDEHDYLSAHVMDSLGVVQSLLKMVKMGLLPSNTKIADLGVGGGFPGMLLAIFIPNFEFFLVDAVRKKTAFLLHAKGRLKLANVVVVEQRIEHFANTLTHKLDATISRAFSELGQFISYSEPLLKEQGIMFAMKSQKIPAELESLPKHYKVLLFEELTIPYLESYRCILAIQSMKKSPDTDRN